MIMNELFNSRHECMYINYIYDIILITFLYKKIMNESQRVWMTQNQLKRSLSILVWAEEFAKLQDSSIAYQSSEEIKDLIDHILTQNNLVRVQK